MVTEHEMLELFACLSLLHIAQIETGKLLIIMCSAELSTVEDRAGLADNIRTLGGFQDSSVSL